MKQQRERREVGAVVWNEEKRELKLCGEPVLEISYRWPAFEGKRFVWANRCYSRLVKLWKGQWERELYLRACVDLAEKREASRPFTPWKASLDGELTLADENYRSVDGGQRAARRPPGFGISLGRYLADGGWQPGAAAKLCSKGGGLEKTAVPDSGGAFGGTGGCMP